MKRVKLCRLLWEEQTQVAKAFASYALKMVAGLSVIEGCLKCMTTGISTGISRSVMHFHWKLTSEENPGMAWNPQPEMGNP